MQVVWGIHSDGDVWEPSGGWNPSIPQTDRVWAQNYWQWLRVVKKLEIEVATQKTMTELYRKRWGIRH